MTREDLYSEQKKAAKRHGKEEAFLKAYPDAKTWIDYNFESEEKVIGVLEKLKKNGVLSKKWKLPIFYKKFVCDLQWAKASPYCGKKTETTSDEYVGKYKTEKTSTIFEVVDESGVYKVKTKVKQVDLTLTLKKEGTDKFSVSQLGMSGTISFQRNAKNVVIGGEIDVSGLGQNIKEKFTKIGVSTDTDQTDDSTEDSVIWDCINAYNKWWGYYKLSEGWDGVNKYGYEHTTHKVNGREVKLLYMDDGRVVMRFEDNDSDVPEGGGKWECDSEGTGYTIKWSNGQVAVFSKKKDFSKNSSIENSSNTDNSTTKQEQSSSLPKFKDVCKAILPCPKRADVKSGKASYKICMRCPEIADLQNGPVFKVIYFKKLKDRGFKESADGVFGPITKLAVEEYQEMNGLKKDGLIGQKTLAQLDKDKS